VDGTNIGGPVDVDANGVATSPTLASPPPGDHTVIAAFSSTGAFAISGDTLTQTVTDAAVNMSVTSSNGNSAYGEGVSFTATVSSTQLGTGVPTGLVQFRIDGAPVGDPVALDDSGVATGDVNATLTPGNHAITAVYSGDEDFLDAVATTTQAVRKVATTTSVTSSLNPATFGQLVTFTATVTPSTNALGLPNGTVTFTDGSTVLGTTGLTVSGGVAKATLSTSSLTGGAHSIRGTYFGTANFAGSISPVLTQTIGKATTTLTATPAVVSVLPASVNVAALQHLNTALPLGVLQAQLTSGGHGVAGEPIVFKIGTTVACTSTTNADGIAQCNAQSKIVALILAGKYVVTFAGDNNYVGSTANGTLIG